MSGKEKTNHGLRRHYAGKLLDLPILEMEKAARQYRIETLNCALEAEAEGRCRSDVLKALAALIGKKRAKPQKRDIYKAPANPSPCPNCSGSGKARLYPYAHDDETITDCLLCGGSGEWLN